MKGENVYMIKFRKKTPNQALLSMPNLKIISLKYAPF